MAKTIITTITDDIDGATDATPSRSGLDGVAYSIDLGPKNEKKLRDALAPFIDKASRSRGAAHAGAAKRNDRDYDIANLREWAAKKASPCRRVAAFRVPSSSNIALAGGR